MQECSRLAVTPKYPYSRETLHRANPKKTVLISLSWLDLNIFQTFGPRRTSIPTDFAKKAAQDIVRVPIIAAVSLVLATLIYLYSNYYGIQKKYTQLFLERYPHADPHMGVRQIDFTYCCTSTQSAPSTNTMV